MLFLHRDPKLERAVSRPEDMSTTKVKVSVPSVLAIQDPSQCSVYTCRGALIDLIATIREKIPEANLQHFKTLYLAKQTDHQKSYSSLAAHRQYHAGVPAQTTDSDASCDNVQPRVKATEDGPKHKQYVPSKNDYPWHRSTRPRCNRGLYDSFSKLLLEAVASRTGRSTKHASCWRWASIVLPI